MLLFCPLLLYVLLCFILCFILDNVGISPFGAIARYRSCYRTPQGPLSKLNAIATLTIAIAVNTLAIAIKTCCRE